MTIALILLPSLLPETSVATLSSGKGKRRSFWKPSVSESMNYFIDVQKVFIIYCYFLMQLLSQKLCKFNFFLGVKNLTLLLVFITAFFMWTHTGLDVGCWTLNKSTKRSQ